MDGQPRRCYHGWSSLVNHRLFPVGQALACRLTQAETVLSTEIAEQPDPQLEADLRSVYDLVEKANALAFRLYQEHRPYPEA